MKKQTLLTLAIGLFAIIGIPTYLYLAKPVEAATIPLSGTPIEVNSISDEGDATSGTGSCETSTPGECTLRAAIQTANSNSNPAEQDHITFNIAGVGVKTIEQIGFQNYYISEPVLIDGYSQPGASANTAAWPNPFDGTLLIELDGSGFADTSACIYIDSDEVTLSGLVINSCTASSIFVAANVDEFDVYGNYFGVDPTGLLQFYSAGNVITAYTSNLSNFTIGGSDPAERNLFASSGPIANINADNLVVQGNYFGVGSDGVTALPGLNSTNSSLLDVSGDTIQIGGSGAGEGNSFENNPVWGGIGVFDSTNVDILGNSVVGNVSGINIFGNTQNVNVGNGTSAGRNIISGNDNPSAFDSAYGSGVWFSDGFSGSNISIKGNYIGVAEDGTTPLGNGNHGIDMTGGSDVVVGGTTADEANIIANNGGSGVYVSGNTTEISVLRNSIYDNDELGIDLRRTSDLTTGVVNPNDDLDPDSGPNSLLNFPSVAAEVNGSDTDLTYRVDVPAGDYVIMFYSNTSADASGNGEGETFIGSDTFTSAGTGNEDFSTTVTGNTYSNVFGVVTEVDLGTSSGYGASSEFGDLFEHERDVSVTKSVVDENTITTDGYIDYTITYTNNGPDPLDVTQFDADAGDPLNTALFNDIFPTNLTFNSVVSGDTSCTESNAANTFGTLFTDHDDHTVLSCAYDGVTPRVLAEDESMTFTLRFDADIWPKVFENFVLAVPLAQDASVTEYSDAVSSGNDIITELGSTSNNLDSVETTAPTSDMAVSLVLTDPENYVQGGTVNYNVTLTNNGADPINLKGYDGTGVNPLLRSVFFVLLPPDLSFQSVSTPNITCPLTAPASVTPFFSNNSDYNLTICVHSDSVDNVLEEDDTFSIDFTADVAADSDLADISYAYIDPTFAGDPDLNDYNTGFNLTNDAIDYFWGNYVNNVTYSAPPTDVAVSMELINQDDVIAGKTLTYRFGLTNNGPGEINLGAYQSNGSGLGNLVIDGASLELISAATDDVNCSALGPGSIAFLGVAGEDHPSHELAACTYNGPSYPLASGETFYYDVEFSVLSDFVDPIVNYLLHTSTPSDADRLALYGLIFGASGDVLDSEDLISYNDYAVLSSSASPIPETPDTGNSGSGSGEQSDSSSGGFLGDTGQQIIGIAVIAGSVAIISLLSAKYIKRRNLIGTR